MLLLVVWLNIQIHFKLTMLLQRLQSKYDKSITFLLNFLCFEMEDTFGILSYNWQSTLPWL